MKDEQYIREQVEQTLQSLDTVGRAQANPFLYTRVQARLQALRNPWEQTLGILTRPIVAIAVVAVVLLANAWIVYQGAATPDTANAVTATNPAEDSDGYGLAVNTFYDYEIPDR